MAGSRKGARAAQALAPREGAKIEDKGKRE